ncbi:MAG: glycoside hydrolase family 13 protein [Bacteroidota bacterium]
MKKTIFLLFLIFNILMINAQEIQKVEPPYWWVGMKNTKLQLMVYGKNIEHTEPEISDKNVILDSISKSDNPNYIFLNLDLSKVANAKKFEINFKNGNSKKLSYTYELKQREENSTKRKGFDSSDVIYLITPDRFANANPENDINSGMKEKTIDRKHDYARHGGDIEGITKHLDYIHEMGFTAIWPTPVLTNDMPQSSYHGYAMTDFYQVDPRFGTMEEYISLSEIAREKGIKLIMDQVANHCGSEHWWMKDLPFDDWINFQEELKDNLTVTNHRRTTNQDLYASQKDKKLMSKGWFVSAMPDLNQENPFMAKYIIQNSIWWVETLGLQGIRQDTYPYPDKDFMSQWAGAIMNEYPDFSIVGEEWSYNPLLVGYWQQGSNNKDGYQSNLRSSMDFPMQKAIVDGLNEEESWGTGLVKMYEGLANDFAYTTPKDIMIFLDNHDKNRVYTEFKENVVLTQMALGYMLTLPRIPQIYYGTEILLENSAKPGDHGLIRTDFPGGWKGDKINGFTGKGLTKDQKEMKSFLQKILNYRKTSEAIHKGKTIHFSPKDGIYVLFRTIKSEVVVMIINKNDSPMILDLDRFEEIGINGKKLKNVISDEVFIWNDQMKFNSKGIIILTTKLK